ncbi:MAG TPA: hypothetical protein VGJ05_09405 [Fimbriiglobus sp.]|jgi:hypothetical protein
MDWLKRLLPGLLLVLSTGVSQAQTPADSNGGTTDPNEILWTVGQPPDPNKQTPPPVTPIPPATNPQGRSPLDTLTEPANRPARLSLSSRVNWKAPMMGDFPGYYTYGNLNSVTTLTLQVRNPDQPNVPFTIQSTDTLRVATLLLTRAGVKVAENESPIPQDRVYATYNYYYRVAVPVASRTNTLSTANGPIMPGSTGFPDSFNDILVSPMTAQVLTAGIEKTILDGRASIGIRVPFYFSSQSFSSTPNQGVIDSTFGQGVFAGQIASTSDGLGGSAVGDMSVLFKYALFRNEETGNLLSTGLVITAPTGKVTAPADAVTPSDVLLQPFVGYVVNFDKLYFHAFHSVIVPTQSSDVTLLANDLGVGFRAFEREAANGTFAIIPTFETHVTTPLNHRDRTGPFYADDLVVLTAGTHFLFGQSAVMTLGVGTPVTGPRPFQVEPEVRLNWYY